MLDETKNMPLKEKKTFVREEIMAYSLLHYAIFGPYKLNTVDTG